MTEKEFTPEQIQKIYETVVKKDPSYFGLRSSLPKCPIKKWNYRWEGKDRPRCFAVLDFIDWTRKHSITSGDTLGITFRDDPELEFLSYETTIDMPFPEYDLHTYHEKFSNSFDLFVFNQTIEHLYNPLLCLKNIYKYVKPGGYVFTSVPTINIPHMTPYHYGGFNPMGLTMMFLSAGFEVVETGQWGNLSYIIQIFRCQDWNMNGVSNVNCEKNVAQCWILAKKCKQE